MCNQAGVEDLNNRSTLHDVHTREGNLGTFKTTYRVRWSDVDAAQVVHHPNYLRFFQIAEEEFYEHLGLGLGYAYFVKHGIWLPRTKVFCQYHTPSNLGDTLEISLIIKDIREKSIKYDFLVKKKGSETLVAEGYVVAVATDKKMKKSIEIPHEIVEKLKTFRNTKGNNQL